MTGSRLSVVSLAERPDLEGGFWAVDGGWPDFMLHDPVAARGYGRAVELYPDLHLVGLEEGPEGSEEVRARLHAVPIPWPGLSDLPPRGWDWALERATLDGALDGRAAVSLIEARVDVTRRSRGWSRDLLVAARERFAALGCLDLVGPVRPTGRAEDPSEAFAAYVRRTRDDGLPVDPWLRAHVRLGGVVGPVAPLSMVIPGTLHQWEAWTGRRLGEERGHRGAGPVVVDGGLVPVHVDPAQDHAVYVEPNVWVHHDLRR